MNSDEKLAAHISASFAFCEHMCEKIPRKAANMNTERAVREAIYETRKRDIEYLTSKFGVTNRAIAALRRLQRESEASINNKKSS